MEWTKRTVASNEYPQSGARPTAHAHGARRMNDRILTARPASPRSAQREDDGARRATGRMVICLDELPNGAVIERYFQERGWRVHLAQTSCQARTLVRETGASVAVLAEETPGQESGWLTCWKLLHETPQTRVFVVGASHVERGERRAAVVGAAGYFHCSESAAGVYRSVHADRGAV